MQRIFTKNMGNFKKGEIKEYPSSTWTQIEKSAKESLNAFTKTVETAAEEGINTVSIQPEDVNLTLRRRSLRSANT